MMVSILRVACGGFAVYHNGLYWPVTTPSLRHRHVPVGYQGWYRHSDQIAEDIAYVRVRLVKKKPSQRIRQATKELQQLIGSSRQTLTTCLTDAVIERLAHEQITGSMLWLLLQFPEEEAVAAITNVRRICEDLATEVVLRVPQAPRPAVKEEKPDEDEAATNQMTVATAAAAAETPQWQSPWNDWQGHSSWYSWHEQRKAGNWTKWQPGESSSSTWRSSH